MNVLFLRDRIAWFGSHTGYEQLTCALPKADKVSSTSITPVNCFPHWFLGKLTSLALGHGSINQIQAASRLDAFLRLALDQRAVLHILYGEEHAPYWRSFPRQLHHRTVLTIHQPSSRWTRQSLSRLQWVQHAILLYRRDLDFFQTAMPEAKIHCILYGVDINFFHPGPDTTQPRSKRLLYNGVHLRNVAMLRRLVPAILARKPNVKFDFLVPNHRRDDRVFGDLLQHPAVEWHAELDDNQLRALYQQAYAMLLPMSDSGANTAVVEAHACGLPVITTDVGGIRDYGGGSLYPIVPNDDDDAMLALVEKYLNQPDWRDEVSRKGRHFAETTLAWPIVAQQHVQVYRETLALPPAAC